MILADTSAWINFTFGKDKKLSEFLADRKIVMHKYVIGELRCGRMKNREQFFDYLNALTCVEERPHEEVFAMIENYKFMGQGVKFIDMHVIAACHAYGLQLYTSDARMLEISKRLRS